MLTDNLAFYQSKSYIKFLYKYWRSQKPSPRPSTNLYNQVVYFDRWDQFKERKAAQIRTRYNQVLHLTQDTTWESDKNTIKLHNQEVSPFPAGDHRAAMNRRESLTK